MNAYGTTTEALIYLHTDHLLTPRLATDSSGTVVWRWEGEAFGQTLANEDPDGDGRSVVVNLRFPGQYYDQETGLHYNYFRYYDPITGRYLTSDPIGLSGGLNTYGYVGGNPLRFIDPTGTSLINHIIHIGEAPISIFGQIVPRLLGNPVVQSGLVGYGAGTLINKGIEQHIFGDRSSIGSELFDFLNPEPVPADIILDLPSTLDLPDLSSPNPVDEKTQARFCEQNPDAPNCQENCR